MGQYLFKDATKDQASENVEDITETPKNKRIINLDIDPRSPGIGRTPLQVCVRGSTTTPDTPTIFK